MVRKPVAVFRDCGPSYAADSRGPCTAPANSKRDGRKVSLREAICLPDGQNADLLALDVALKALEQVDARKCQAVELRYFGGLSIDEIAGTLKLSTKTVRRDLTFAEAWLHQQITGDTSRETRTMDAS